MVDVNALSNAGVSPARKFRLTANDGIIVAILLRVSIAYRARETNRHAAFTVTPFRIAFKMTIELIRVHTSRAGGLSNSRRRTFLN